MAASVGTAGIPWRPARSQRMASASRVLQTTPEPKTHQLRRFPDFGMPRDKGLAEPKRANNAPIWVVWCVRGGGSKTQIAQPKPGS